MLVPAAPFRRDAVPWMVMSLMRRLWGYLLVRTRLTSAGAAGDPAATAGSCGHLAGEGGFIAVCPGALG